MPSDCEVESPGDFEDAGLDNGLGNDGAAGFAERCKRDAVGFNRAIGEASGGFPQPAATNTVEGIQRGLGSPAFPFVLDEIAQVVALDQNRSFRVHHAQTVGCPVADRARRDAGYLRRLVNGIGAERFNPVQARLLRHVAPLTRLSPVRSFSTNRAGHRE